MKECAEYVELELINVTQLQLDFFESEQPVNKRWNNVQSYCDLELISYSIATGILCEWAYDYHIMKECAEYVELELISATQWQLAFCVSEQQAIQRCRNVRVCGIKVDKRNTIATGFLWEWATG